jgi:hypothetical protein
LYEHHARVALHTSTFIDLIKIIIRLKAKNKFTRWDPAQASGHDLDRDVRKHLLLQKYISKLFVTAQ